MLVQCTEEWEDRIFSYIGENQEACLYLYVDVRRYGLSSGLVRVWAQCTGDEIHAIAMSYHNGMHLYSRENRFDGAEIFKLIHELKPTMVFAQKRMIQELEKYADGYQVKYGYVKKMKELDYETMSKRFCLASNEDVPQMAEMLYADRELTGSYSYEELEAQLRERIQDGCGRSFLLKDKGQIIAQVSTSAEIDSIAIINMLMTDGNYRGKGLASELLRSVGSELKDAYSLYLYCYGKEKSDYYDRHGFFTCQEWGKLYRLVEQQEKQEMKDNRQFIIYGAGKQGRGYFDFLISKGVEDYIAGFCDKNYEAIREVKGKRVYSYEEARKTGFPFLLAVADKGAMKEIEDIIREDGGSLYALDELSEVLKMDRVTFNREFCAFFHIHSMNAYFEAAESEKAIKCFWNETSPFYQMFQKLDLSNVIELACGRGRHVPQYREKAGAITLVDILNENIEFCRNRFKDRDNIAYYCNNGYNLQELSSDAYSALFSYDAVVHFEMMDIYEYLKDIFRVLKPGGQVLIHHSNYDGSYKASFGTSPSGRSFMNLKIFAYLAYRAGFEVEEQKEIDWGIENLDGLTLLKKPGIR